MATHPKNGWILLDGWGGAPVNPQPDTFDDREAPAGHLGRVVRAPDGSYEKAWRPDVVPVGVPRTLTPNQVIDLLLTELGTAGFAACVRSDADVMVAWRYKMSVAKDISKQQAADGMAIIVAAGLMTGAQRTAILASWPVS